MLDILTSAHLEGLTYKSRKQNRGYQSLARVGAGGERAMKGWSADIGSDELDLTQKGHSASPQLTAWL